MSIKWPFAILFAGGALAVVAIGEARLARVDSARRNVALPAIPAPSPGAARGQ